MKYAIGIVTYQPDLQQLSENMNRALDNPEADCLIIVDNGSENTTAIKSLAQESKQTVFIENRQNLGIACALNQICQKATDLGYDWVLTLDQDSVMQDDMLGEYALYVDRHDIGIICPRIEDVNMGRQYVRSDKGSEYINHCITAGNLVRLTAWKAIGGYNEELFIDGVDFDFCMKIGEAGFNILRTNNVCLIQQIGHGRSIALPFGHQISILNHSPLRLYYISRNYLYIGRHHHQFLHWALEVAKRMFIVLIFEQDKWQKLRYMIAGIHHFHKGIMGQKSI